MFFFAFKKVDNLLNFFLLKHENFDDVNLFNDIGLIILSKEVELNNYIQIACLPAPSTTYPNPNGPNPFAYAAGWGTLYTGGPTPSQLNNLKLTIYPSTYCYGVNDGINNWNGQICAGEIAGNYFRLIF